MNGTVFKRCPCTEAHGRARRQGACKRNHGSWYFIHDLPILPGEKRQRIRRGGYTSKEAAESALADSLIRFRQRGVAAERDLTGRRMFLADYLREWLDRRTNLKANTRRTYEMHIQRYLVPHLGHLRLEELGAQDIEDAYAALRTTLRRAPIMRHRKRLPTKQAKANQAKADQSRRLSPASMQRLHATLRKALNDAVRRYKYLDVNPAQYVELESVTTPKARYWNSRQAGRFLDAIVDDPLYPLYHLAVTRGPRRGEIVALRWSDIDLDDGLLEISRSIVQLGYRTEETTPKNASSHRIIALDEDNQIVLKAHRRRQKRARATAGLPWQEDGPVFAQEDGTPLHPEFVSRHLGVLIEQINKTGPEDDELPRITFHQLRHTAASLMLEAGADLKYVQHVLGHASITITGTLYTHITRRLDRLRSAQVADLIPRQQRLLRFPRNRGGFLMLPRVGG